MMNAQGLTSILATASYFNVLRYRSISYLDLILLWIQSIIIT